MSGVPKVFFSLFSFDFRIDHFRGSVQLTELNFFPSTSEYVVNLIRIMYALNTEQPAQRSVDQNRRSAHRQLRNRNPSANGRPNSPQPSNHSEITTASSNSDSGIGFHNDFANVSDRIVVVDFPNGSRGQHRMVPRLPSRMQQMHRFSERPVPFGAESVRNIRSTISNSQGLNPSASKPAIFHAKSRSLDYTLGDENHVAGSSSRTSLPNAAVHLVRAMPDRHPAASKMPLQENCASLPNSPAKYEQYETIFGTDSEKTISEQATHKGDIHQHSDDDEIQGSRHNLVTLTARSCDDLMMTSRAHQFPKTRQVQQLLASFDDVSLLDEAPPPPLPHRSKTKNRHDGDNDDYVFLAPQAPPLTKKPKKKRASFDRSMSGAKSAIDDILSYKLSPKVFGVAKPHRDANNKANKAKRRLSVEPKPQPEKSVCSIKNRDFNVWGSLQDLEMLNRTDTAISADQRISRRDFMEPAYSEPDLLVGFQSIFCFAQKLIS